ncbi:MAG TPA: N-acetylglucosamine-6-phosphate deacetylase [Trebonia sp.]|jgi:N-acetylglucosamine-6-phosphate deacetylase|nr:N-acetylglucosamine-6-phosphate deacetylase [Trebonia sp.]
MQIRGKIPTAGLADGVVTVTDDVITSVEAAGTTDLGDAGKTPGGEFILPGFIDLHCHGGGGHGFSTTDPAEALAVAAHHAARGTTGIIASLVTAAPADMIAQVRALAPLVASGDLLGIHLEGPFLSSARCGAQAPEFIRDPDPALAADLLDAAGGAIKIVTLAPERPMAREVASLFRSAGVVVALGHTDSSFGQMTAGLATVGESALVTHLANGMPPLHHRSAGPVAAALVAAAEDAASVELIADGVHVDEGFTRLVFATAAPGRVVLITDAMAAAGMSDGLYELGPQRVRVADGVARLESHGGALAGGTSSLVQVVATAHAAGVPLADAARAASSAPARVLALGAGLEVPAGTLAVGARADLVVTDDRLRVRRVLRAGRWIK